MVRTQIQLTAEQCAQAKRLASEQHVSMAEVIRQGLDRYLQEHLSVTHDERVSRAIAAAGRFRSGAGDVSVEHDRYLAEAFAS